MAFSLPFSRFVSASDFPNPRKTFPLRISTRRCPAGVDRHFDDAHRDIFELIRLARRGHIFEICLGELRYADKGLDERETVQ